MSQADPVTGRYPAKFLADLARVKYNEADGSMPTDLTGRLAAKLYQGPYFNTEESNRVARYADVVLPLLLSEPELVAGLAPEVKREVLRQLPLDHPEAREEEAGGPTLGVPDVLTLHSRVTLRFLANWLAPSETR